MRSIHLTASRLTSPSVPRMTSGGKLPGKSLTPEQWCYFCNERVLPILKVCVSNLVEYLDYLQVTHDYAYTTLCMHASAICSIVQPTEHTKTSTAPLVKYLIGEVFRKKPARVWADTWDVRKVLDLLHVWGKPLVLIYMCLTLKTVMILALATVKRPSDLNLLRITPVAMEILEDSFTFQLGWG